MLGRCKNNPATRCSMSSGGLNQSGNYPLIQATAMLLATIFIVFNLLVDVLYSVLDPRITLE